MIFLSKSVQHAEKVIEKKEKKVIKKETIFLCEEDHIFFLSQIRDKKISMKDFIKESAISRAVCEKLIKRSPIAISTLEKFKIWLSKKRTELEGQGQKEWKKPVLKKIDEKILERVADTEENNSKKQAISNLLELSTFIKNEEFSLTKNFQYFSQSQCVILKRSDCWMAIAVRYDEYQQGSFRVYYLDTIFDIKECLKRHRKHLEAVQEGKKHPINMSSFFIEELIHETPEEKYED